MHGSFKLRKSVQSKLLPNPLLPFQISVPPLLPSKSLWAAWLQPVDPNLWSSIHAHPRPPSWERHKFDSTGNQSGNKNGQNRNELIHNKRIYLLYNKKKEMLVSGWGSRLYSWSAPETKNRAWIQSPFSEGTRGGLARAIQHANLPSHCSDTQRN